MTSTTTYTYDGDGKLISQSIDNNSDGTIDSVINYGYKLTSLNRDTNGDGIADYRNVAMQRFYTKIHTSNQQRPLQL
jgi:hypothetical protein